MKAVFMREHGDSSVLEYGEFEDPKPANGEVLLKIKASSLNRLDIYTRIGMRGTKLPEDRFPHILGGDTAGDIIEVGEGVSSDRIGQRVVVNPMLAIKPRPVMLGSQRLGSYAELVAVPESSLVIIPDHLSYQQAAALPTVYLPTWAIIVREANLQPFETALILSASSGVGTAAIQIVKGVVGAKCITTTSSQSKVDAAMSLGADHVINYSTEDIATSVKEFTDGKGVDLVVDATGTQFFEAAYGSLAPGGRYGVCGITTGYQANLHLGQLFSKALHLFGVFMGSTDELMGIVDAAGNGSITSAIHATFPLNETQSAHDMMEGAQHFGKIILSME